MFRDASEELKRLQEELLAEEEPVEEIPEEEPEEEYPYDEYEDTRPAQGPAVYHNYANDYGKNLRNYASGYQAYNSDSTDADLEEYSQEVYNDSSRGNCLLAVIAAFLALGIVAVVGIWFAYMRGYIG